MVTCFNVAKEYKQYRDYKNAWEQWHTKCNEAANTNDDTYDDLIRKPTKEWRNNFKRDTKNRNLVRVRFWDKDCRTLESTFLGTTRPIRYQRNWERNTWGEIRYEFEIFLFYCSNPATKVQRARYNVSQRILGRRMRIQGTSLALVGKSSIASYKRR